MISYLRGVSADPVRKLRAQLYPHASPRHFEALTIRIRTERV